MYEKSTTENPHELMYASLRATGHPGWGGAQFQERERKWEECLKSLQNNAAFPKPGAAILEVGCGTGIVSRILARAGYLVSGIDISPTAVDWARELAQKESLAIEYFEGDVCLMDGLRDNRFDAVIDGACLHCLIGENRARFLLATKRVLKSRGLLFISSMIGEPHDLTANISNSVVYDPLTRYQLRNGKPYRFMSEKSALFSELESARFEVIHSKVHKHLWWDHLYALCQSVD